MCIVDAKSVYLFIRTEYNFNEARIESSEMGSNKKHKKHKSERREKYEGNIIGI